MSAPLDLAHRLDRAPLIRDREVWLLAECAGKRVLHVGCVDAGMLDDRLEHDALLHAHLGRRCAGVLGLDVDAPGVARLAELGHDNVLAGDIATEHERVADELRKRLGGCDVIVCGEVLEHVLDMSGFLAGVRAVAAAFDAQVVFTVPNAYSLERAVPLAFGTELIHPDHKCYFSRITLRTLLDQTGFESVTERFYSTDRRAASGLRLFAKRVLNRTLFALWPQFATGLVAVARPAKR